MTYFQDLDTQIKQLTDEVARICWYMRGSVSWTEAHDLCIMEREIINAVIKDNIDLVKKTKMPLL